MCIERAACLTLDTKQSPCVQGGFSLIELIAFIAIVGAALAGVLSVLNVTAGHSADPMVRKQMLSIAESLMEEVESQPFTVCAPADANAGTATTTAGCATSIQGFGRPAGVGAAAARSLYDNVGSYCDTDGTGQITCPPLTLGTASSASSTIPDLTGAGASPPGYWATIQLDATDTLGGIVSSATLVGMVVLRITVTVHYYNSSEQIVLEGYRTRWMPHL